VRAQGRLLRGWSEIAAACISVSRRPHAASCIKAHWPACSLGRRSGFVVLPQGYLPHRQGRASARLLRSLKHAPVSSVVVCGRSDAPNRGYWHLCRAVGGGARGPACRAPGSIGGVWSVAIALNTRQGTILLVVLPDLPRRSGSHTWTVLLVPDPTLLLVPVPEPITQHARFFDLFV
jgi:hypothetical protein